MVNWKIPPQSWLDRPARLWQDDKIVPGRKTTAYLPSCHSRLAAVNRLRSVVLWVGRRLTERPHRRFLQQCIFIWATGKSTKWCTFCNVVLCVYIQNSAATFLVKNMTKCAVYNSVCITRLGQISETFFQDIGGGSGGGRGGGRQGGGQGGRAGGVVVRIPLVLCLLRASCTYVSFYKMYTQEITLDFL